MQHDLLMKNLRNYWITKKNGTLEFVDLDSGKKLLAKWNDIVLVCKQEEKNFVKKTPFNYQTLCPNNFEKQKVQLI